MVSLPVKRQTNSSTTAVSSAPVSEVLVALSPSKHIGTITSIQPDRTREIVPSKSNITTRVRAAEAFLFTISITSDSFPWGRKKDWDYRPAGKFAGLQR